MRAAKDEPILLTTLKRTIPFYTPHGFSRITGSMLPRYVLGLEALLSRGCVPTGLHQLWL